MQYFPINIRCSDATIIVVGGGEDVVAKIRLLLKTEARIAVFAPKADPAIAAWHDEGRLHHYPRQLAPQDLAAKDLAPKNYSNTRLAYISGADSSIRDQAIHMLDKHNILYCVIDDLPRSRFITPAIVDRDPVTIAIGTEGTAPVLVRRIKAMIEQNLSPHTGILAAVSGQFRQYVAHFSGRFRRQFWGQIFDHIAPSVLASADDHIAGRLNAAMHTHLKTVKASSNAPPPPHLDQPDLPNNNPLEPIALEPVALEPIAFVSAGPGDPDLLTVKARTYLDQAEVILHDRLVPPAILELARREAVMIEVGKTGYGASTPQEDIHALLIKHGASGANVVRLKSGDAGIFGRLDEECSACRNAGLSVVVIPGITAAAAAAANMKVSLTRRGRNSEWRLLTARDMKGFVDHQWQDLATSGAVSAIYMGLKAIPFLQGRLLMHGGDPALPITLASQVSQPQQRFVATRLGHLADDSVKAQLTGPVVIMLGLYPDPSLENQAHLAHRAKQGSIGKQRISA